MAEPQSSDKDVRKTPSAVTVENVEMKQLLRNSSNIDISNAKDSPSDPTLIDAGGLG